MHMTRSDLHAVLKMRGASVVLGTRNDTVTLLVVGDLPARVTDPVNSRSRNLVYVEEQRAQENHVCIVDDYGISELLRGGAAPCLLSRALDNGEVELRAPEIAEADPPRLVPLVIGAAPVHGPLGLEVDLGALDAGSEAHQQTLRALVVSLAPTVAQAIAEPRVDAAWLSTRAGALCVAEVKSLTGTVQSQQIRLGIGQILDYSVVLRAHPPEGVESVVPVLVLEREPDEPERWGAVCAAVGIALTWSPQFEGLPR